ncbi:hypothetical protein PBCVFr5L_554R [Paramecium bursaria Chlorella virus Fr5L]|nr:hypothetical protein PBCVCZ2_547R [Paramecium bursaria Chlorella virus CZ-2]AGE53236.1 hypothetical protein PBCVFr5L_554R [Paramecium bursaria Chlorella virus Fr5L]
MTILTIECLCTEHDLELRKLLSTKRGFVPCDVMVDYDNPSTIFSAVSTFASLMKTRHGILLFPLSMLRLVESEYYDVTMKLIQKLGVCEHEQLIVCIDSNPNDVLMENFEHGILKTLDEIKELRALVNTEAKDFRVFGNTYSFFHTVPAKLISVTTLVHIDTM